MKQILITLLIITSLYNSSLSQDCVLEVDINYTWKNPDDIFNGTTEETIDFPFTVFSNNSGDCNNLNIDKPIILLEGYDIFDREDPQEIFDTYLDAHGLGQQLLNDGFDIIVPNLNAPSLEIQFNSYLFEKFISYINGEKKSNEELIIIGVSLGGVISRYTLSKMEQDNIPHQTKLFISFDSPQKGANVPLSVQAFIAEHSAFSAFSPDITLLKYHRLRAGTQQLVYPTLGCKDENYFYTPHLAHEDFYNELASLTQNNGYPQKCKNVAISNGTLNGMGFFNTAGATALIAQIGFYSRVLTTAPGGSDLLWDSDIFSYYYASEPHDIGIEPDNGRFFSIGFDNEPFDNLPGGYYNWFGIVSDELNNADIDHIGARALIEDACFISTNSALDLSTDISTLNLANYGKDRILSNTPFDDIWWDVSHSNMTHTELSSDISIWIEDQIYSVDNEDIYVTHQNTLTLNNYSPMKNEVIKAGESITIESLSRNLGNGDNIEIVAGNNIFVKNLQIDKGANIIIKATDVENLEFECLNNLPSNSNTRTFNDDFSNSDQLIQADTIVDGKKIVYYKVIEKGSEEAVISNQLATNVDENYIIINNNLESNKLGVKVLDGTKYQFYLIDQFNNLLWNNKDLNKTNYLINTDNMNKGIVFLKVINPTTKTINYHKIIIN
ncbi:hypothetical protein [Flammeovirga sp. SJP92]|uniref:hypothetical protein n=1 Tax=Flammeovirga sp. SJP92 TaxID=1775430 RepID=UPI000788A83A|nr:hypothetical protein [Flammeovirga sp. SJP92]KXX71241.1 hypothetical protein AVL50_09295 [Flammeovirga sp. SJP92]